MLKLLLHTPLLGLLLAPIVTALADAVKRLWPWLDAQAPIVKQSAAVVLAFILVGLSNLIPGIVPDACANVASLGISDACQQALASSAFLQAAVAGLGAIAIKHGQQNAGK